MNHYNRLAPYYEFLYEGTYEDIQTEEVDWLDDFFQAQGITQVLDCSCGDGFHAVPLAQRGHQLTGSDLSRGMIRQAKLRSKQAGVHFPLHVLDFCQLNKTFAPASFEVVLALGHSLMHVLDADQTRRALQQMKRVLKPEGFLILDFPDFEALEDNRLSKGMVTEEKGYHVLYLSHWDRQGDVVYLHFYRILSRGRNARTRKFTIPLRYWNSSDFEALITSAGFRIVHQEQAAGNKGHYFIAQ